MKELLPRSVLVSLDHFGDAVLQEGWALNWSASSERSSSPSWCRRGGDGLGVNSGWNGGLNTQVSRKASLLGWKRRVLGLLSPAHLKAGKSAKDSRSRQADCLVSRLCTVVLKQLLNATGQQRVGVYSAFTTAFAFA